MNRQEINKKTQQILFEFEAMENLSASDDWDAILTNKLLLNRSVKQDYTRNYKWIVICLVVINASFIAYSFVRTSEKKERMAFNLRLVSDEILIPSTN